MKYHDRDSRSKESTSQYLLYGIVAFLIFRGLMFVTPIRNVVSTVFDSIAPIQVANNNPNADASGQFSPSASSSESNGVGIFLRRFLGLNTPQPDSGLGGTANKIPPPPVQNPRTTLAGALGGDSKNPLGDNGSGSKNALGGPQTTLGANNHEAVDPSPVDKMSKELVQNFEKTAHLQIGPVEGMQFVNVDMDFSDIATLYGVDSKSKVAMSVLARVGNANPNDVVPFLVANEGSIPNLPIGIASQMRNPIRGVATPGSGLYDPYIWEVTQAGNTYVISLVQRRDNRGVYLGVVSGPSSTLGNGEAHFENLFSQIKTSN